MKQMELGEDAKYTSGNKAFVVSIRRRVFSIPTLLSFSIAGLLIVVLLTQFEFNWKSSWENVRGMNPWLYILAIVLYYVSFLFRGLRWRLIARNAELDTFSGSRLPSAMQAAALIVVGWFLNSITWFRLGDAYRAYSFAEFTKASFPWSLGTVLAERVMDMATVFFALLVSALLLTAITGSNTSLSIVMIATIMASGLLGLTFIMKGYGTRLARILPSRFQIGYQRFHQGTLGSFKKLPSLFILGFLGWLMEVARLYFVIEALNLSISWPLIPIVALGHAILSTFPTPGGIGVVEPGLTGLLMLDLERHDAVSIALVDRSITYASVILVGGLAFFIMQTAKIKRSRAITS